MRKSLNSATGVAAKLVRLCALGVAAAALVGTAALANGSATDTAEVRTTAGAAAPADLIWG
ncbi:hypothetical protein ACFQVC_34555 [Streptomyces monticola]|uniref:Uncharacterized protein n=1 Tax=Streptomyces monticola TaxID=2666263 RepID=A0ABW2JV87_9ACTN